MSQPPPYGQSTITISTSGYPQQNYGPPPGSYQPPYGAPQPPYVTPQPPYVTPKPPNESWFERNQRNKPQSNSVGSAALIFLTGGMSAAWSIGYRIVPRSFNTFHMEASWFIGAMIGAFVSALLTNRIPKKMIYICSAVMVLIGGIIFTAADTSDGFLAARYLIGIGNGLIFVACMTFVGEESVKELRGLLAASIETSSFNLGMAMQVIYTMSWSTSSSSYNSSFDSNQLFGVLCITFGAIALLVMLFLLVESPVALLAQNRNEEALEAVRRLASPAEMTTARYIYLDEINQYVSRNQDMSMADSVYAALPGLLKLVFYRCLLAMTYTKIINNYFVTAYVLTLGSVNDTWPTIVYYLLRWLGSFVTAMGMDSLGRKLPALVSILVAGALIFGIGSIFSEPRNFLKLSEMRSAFSLFLVYSFFVGLFTSASSPYLTEAFPMKVKPVFISIVYVCEMLLSMLLLLVDAEINRFDTLYKYFYALGSLAMVFFVMGIFLLPETKRLRLLDAQLIFQKLIITNPFHP